MTDVVEVLAAVSRDADGPPALERLTLGPLCRGEVLVRVTHAGVCHTDLSCHAGIIPSRKPIVLGHEGAGVVEAVADDVTSVAVGVRVVMSMMSCGSCRLCRAGDTAYCDQSAGLNIRGGGVDGDRTYLGSDVYRHFFGQSSFATYAVAHKRNVVPVPDELPLGVAAPLGCGIMTGAGSVLNALRLRPGESIAVFGAGAVGLAAVAAAHLSGASTITVVDPVPSRLALASELGATATLDARAGDIVAAIRDHTGGGADYVVEASGHPTALGQAIEAVGTRGVCAIVGAGHGRIEFDTTDLRVRGASIRGVSMGDANPRQFLPHLMREVLRGTLPLDRLVSRYDIADIAIAFADAHAGRVIKPVLVMPFPGQPM
jgi:aryl-alcohol dehydrogenase